MAIPVHLACIRCSASYPLTAYARGCPTCATAGIHANLTVRYAHGPRAERPPARGPHQSIWRFDALLPAGAAEAVSLGEGGTALVNATRLGLGDVWIKDESRNPTGSFKDRLASASVTMARKLRAQVICSSSSGNAGAATAAYAAKAGLPCVVVTYQGASGPLVTQIRAYGAMVLSVPTSADRWNVLSSLVDSHRWYPTSVYYGPAVGSNPYGIEGYKTLAYEIAEALDWQAPDWCVLPVCYGDSLYGIWKGFDEMRAAGWIERVPRLVAAEVSGSFVAALADNIDMPPTRTLPRASIATSIGATQGTYQGMHAIRATRGRALHVADDDILAWQRRLAHAEGIWAEPAAAATLPAIDALRKEGVIRDEHRVVALLTAGGLKDPAPTQAALPALPTVTGDPKAALAALKEHYGYDADG